MRCKSLGIYELKGTNLNLNTKDTKIVNEK